MWATGPCRGLNAHPHSGAEGEAGAAAPEPRRAAQRQAPAGVCSWPQDCAEQPPPRGSSGRSPPARNARAPAGCNGGAEGEMAAASRAPSSPGRGGRRQCLARGSKGAAISRQLKSAGKGRREAAFSAICSPGRTWLRGLGDLQRE
ncbi:uncharacterized protein VSU04_004670 [Chlamydotis macqueenii]